MNDDSGICIFSKMRFVFPCCSLIILRQGLMLTERKNVLRSTKARENVQATSALVVAHTCSLCSLNFPAQNKSHAVKKNECIFT